MFEGIALSGSISFIIVFLEGVLSFFSPCIIPLIPVYMAYLAGNTRDQGDYGEITYNRKKVMLHTVFFVLGISTAFFILGMAFTALGSFFSSNKMLFTRAGGILIIVLGLFQLGVFDFKFLQRERKIHMNIQKNVNPLIAYIMGFTFSFGWTPCVGPALSSVLILASGAKTALIGNLLVLLYAIGFILPFLLLGLFTTQVLNFLQKKKKIMKYAMKAGGILLIIIGIMTFTGWMNGVSSYLNSISNNQSSSQDMLAEEEESPTAENEKPSVEEEKKDSESHVAAPDFTLRDQYGKEHALSDYKGKVVFLNFWATWCPPCKEEMPDIEELYQEYNLNQEDVIFLGVANPKSDEYPQGADEEKGEIISFLEKNGYTFPTVFDESGEIYNQYQITAFPTTYIIDQSGNIAGYIPGMITKDIMKNAINQALDLGPTD